MKLLSALGENYDVIIEMVDFLNGDFEYSEAARKIKGSFIEPMDELVLLCTTHTAAVFDDLEAILSIEYPDISLNNIDLEIQDITNVRDDEKIRNTIFNTVERYQKDKLIVSSAGRKDITQRIVEAGYIYGFYGYLSITLSAEFFHLKNTPGGLKDYQIARKYPEHLIINWYPLSTLLRRRYYLPETTQVDIQQSNYDILKEPDLIQNFSALYSLPLMIIQRLKSEKIGVDKKYEQKDYTWLRALPKTDLHCHFGGAAGPEELKTIAEAILGDTFVKERWRTEIQSVEKKLRNCSLEEELYKRKGTTQKHPLHYLEEYYKEIYPGLPVFLINTVQLSILSVNEISRLMRQTPAQPNTYESDTDTEGLELYMDAGNFGGSMLFQTKTALETAMHCLLEASLKDNIRYLEVRVSPMNYCTAGLTASEVMNTLIETSAQFISAHPAITVNFIIIATRHKDRANISKNISTAIVFSENKSKNAVNMELPSEYISSPHVCGVDLAGKERGFSPMQFIDLFQPLHHHFIKVTIHAGETESSQNILGSPLPPSCKKNRAWTETVPGQENDGISSRFTHLTGNVPYFKCQNMWIL